MGIFPLLFILVIHKLIHDPKATTMVKALPLLAIITALGVMLGCQNPSEHTGKEEQEDTPAYHLVDTNQIENLVKLGEGEPPVEHFFRNPKRDNYELSPNGQYISYLAPYKDRMNIYVRKVGQQEVSRLTHAKNKNIKSYFWANNDRIVFYRKRSDTTYHLFAADLLIGQQSQSEQKKGFEVSVRNVDSLTPFPGVSADVLDPLMQQPAKMIIHLNKENRKFFEPYRLDVNTGDLQKLADIDNTDDPIIRWITDHNGKLRAAVRKTGKHSQTILYRTKETDTFQQVLSTGILETVNIGMFTFNNENFYALSNLNRDKKALVKLDAETGEELEVIYKHPEYDMQGAIYSRKRETLVSVYYRSWKVERKFLDSKRKRLYQRLNKKLGDFQILISGRDKAEEKFIVKATGARFPGAFYFYNRNTYQLKKLANVNPDIKRENMADMKPVQYTSRDSLTIHGYLTVPQGKEAKNLPVVVKPSPSFFSRDVWGFEEDVQFLASRGYAVFQVNYRGSQGYGKSFQKAGFQELGRKAQHDITDGVRWLIKEGIADSSRIAIGGGQFGGYFALNGLIQNPALYTCGINYGGMLDLFQFYRKIPPYNKKWLEFYYKWLGHPEKDSAMLATYSPFYQKDKINKPVFFAYGAQYFYYNKKQTDQMVESLRERGINTPYMIKENEGMEFEKEENKFQYFKAMAGFLKKHMPADKPGEQVP